MPSALASRASSTLLPCRYESVMKLKLALNRNWITLAVAALLGLAAAWLAMRHVEQRVADIEQQARQPMAQAVVARETLAAGARVTHDNVAVREVPREWLHSAAITPEQFDRAAGAALAFPARGGEPLLWSQLKGERAARFSARLAPGRRAVTVPVDQLSSISGLLEPGDVIDLVLDVAKDGRRFSFPLLQEVSVLATGSRVGGAESGEADFTTITLELDPDQAGRLLAARSVGSLSAVLRPPGDRHHAARPRGDAFALLGLDDPPSAPPPSVPVIYGGRGGPIAEGNTPLSPGRFAQALSELLSDRASPTPVALETDER